MLILVILFWTSGNDEHAFATNKNPLLFIIFSAIQNAAEW